MSDLISNPSKLDKITVLKLAEATGAEDYYETTISHDTQSLLMKFFFKHANDHETFAISLGFLNAGAARSSDARYKNYYYRWVGVPLDASED